MAAHEEQRGPVTVKDVCRVKPIGVVRSSLRTREEVIRSKIEENVAEIEVFEEWKEGLEDLDGFSHIIVVFWMHKSSFRSLLVRPVYHPERQRGVFATRHPDRPNPIGLTAVELLKRDNNVLTVKGVDMIDGTPVLDIKPYTRRDMKDGVKFGWLTGIGGLPDVSVRRPPRRRKTQKGQGSRR